MFDIIKAVAVLLFCATVWGVLAFAPALFVWRTFVPRRAKVLVLLFTLLPLNVAGATLGLILLQHQIETAMMVVHDTHVVFQGAVLSIVVVWVVLTLTLSYLIVRPLSDAVIGFFPVTKIATPK